MLRFRLGQGRDHPVGEMVHEVDQKVPRTHGGVADFQFEQSLGRIELLQLAYPPILGKWARGEFGILCSEIVHARSDQRFDRFLEDQADQIVGRVVTARALSREDVGTNSNLAVIADDLVFEQALVDRAELLNAEIAIVDVAADHWGFVQTKAHQWPRP